MNEDLLQCIALFFACLVIVGGCNYRRDKENAYELDKIRLERSCPEVKK